MHVYCSFLAFVSNLTNISILALKEPEIASPPTNCSGLHQPQQTSLNVGPTLLLLQNRAGGPELLLNSTVEDLPNAILLDMEQHVSCDIQRFFQNSKKCGCQQCPQEGAHLSSDHFLVLLLRAFSLTTLIIDLLVVHGCKCHSFGPQRASVYQCCISLLYYYDIVSIILDLLTQLTVQRPFCGL